MSYPAKISYLLPTFVWLTLIGFQTNKAVTVFFLSRYHQIVLDRLQQTQQGPLLDWWMIWNGDPSPFLQSVSEKTAFTSFLEFFRIIEFLLETNKVVNLGPNWLVNGQPLTENINFFLFWFERQGYLGQIVMFQKSWHVCSEQNSRINYIVNVVESGWWPTLSQTLDLELRELGIVPKHLFLFEANVSLQYIEMKLDILKQAPCRGI